MLYVLIFFTIYVNKFFFSRIGYHRTINSLYFVLKNNIHILSYEMIKNLIKSFYPCMAVSLVTSDLIICVQFGNFCSSKLIRIELSISYKSYNILGKYINDTL